MFEKLELSVRSFRKNGCRERFHDFLDGDGGVTKLIFSTTDEAEGTHADGLEIDITSGYFEDGSEDAEFDKVGHCETSDVE